MGHNLYHSCKDILQHINIVQCAFKIIFMEIEHAFLVKLISRQWPECEANPAASLLIGLALHVPGNSCCFFRGRPRLATAQQPRVSRGLQQLELPLAWLPDCLRAS